MEDPTRLSCTASRAGNRHWLDIAYVSIYDREVFHDNQTQHQQWNHDLQP